ncbi:phosphoenolpyruvate carboxykinase (ATP) [Rubricoccus marinus]|uniref:Phosphoenolpyruvate carboxykinase (ATP) n=1 Tax=Rubricoccus marinus TaxID=716817 RepID=A0A259TZE0_9BACT|nr:phosphoenolpyruvate carboxykinase (ATP) [Rubricoccus marinus]OZC03060.1 phosphoenolpyruvate carboxykinase (ATP) [Rubricoccus marinus]
MHAPDSLLRHLDSLGLGGSETLYYNLPPARLVELAVRRGEGRLVADGPLATRTDPHTGRSPNDRFVVREPGTESEVGWGKTNVPISEDSFDHLLKEMGRYARGRTLFVRDCYAGADPRYRVKVRVITEEAWHSLFAYNMFLRPADGESTEDFDPDYTVVDLCDFNAKPDKVQELNSSTFVTLHLSRGLVLIGGTHYAGEIKKSIFSALNFVLPAKGVLPMHCSANEATDGSNTAVFFGLSGTGKTTLSADASRTLIGDDEHGWSDHGVFNFEGGCYAKAIRLSPEGEPEIYNTTKQFGTLVENVILREDRSIDFDDGTITENTRISYPIYRIPNASENGQGGQPETVVFLTADAFGVLPPISKLTPEQAMYHFLSGYTAKVAGTERGVTEPKATFSACFGEPFMVRPPSAYAEMLGEKIREHDARVFLVNTGWTGGPYGTGSRMKLALTRRMLDAALSGELDNVPTTEDPVFGLAIPNAIEGVPSDVLVPRNTWASGEDYDEKAGQLAQMFADNFEKYAANVSEAVREAGPRVTATA